MNATRVYIIINKILCKVYQKGFKFFISLQTSGNTFQNNKGKFELLKYLLYYNMVFCSDFSPVKLISKLY